MIPVKMHTTYIPKQLHVQKKDASSASSVLDNSSQNESLQRKADMANNATQRAEAPRPNNTGMPDNLKSGIESLSGFSMDDVRVHYNSSKPATVQALAYTQGTDIHVAPGQEKHLPHEAWHVAQQMAGRVSPTTNINGMPVNDNAGLEHEADVMGEKAVGQKYSINEKKYTTSIKNDAIQNYYFRQMKYNTNQNVMQCVNIKVYDEVVLPDQTSSSSRTTNTPLVVNKINTINSSVSADSLTTPAESNSSDEFKKRINEALRTIKDEYYVQKILQFPCNIGITIVQTFNDSVGSAWENGKIRGTDYELAMHLGQCDNMFWGTPEAYEKAEKKQGNVPIHLTLLHEFGHAYQHYLKYHTTTLNTKIPLINTKTRLRLKKYPLFFKAILDKDSEHLSSVLKHYEIKEPRQIANKLINYDDSTIIDILNKIEKIAQLGYDPDADSDNMFMNEIPYVKAQNEKGENFPVRGHYSHSYTPTMFDMSIWKFQFFLEKNDLIKTDEQKINDKMDDIDAFFKTCCVDSDLLKKTKNEQWSKSFWENYIYIKYLSAYFSTIETDFKDLPILQKIQLQQGIQALSRFDGDFLMDIIKSKHLNFYKKSIEEDIISFFGKFNDELSAYQKEKKIGSMSLGFISFEKEGKGEAISMIRSITRTYNVSINFIIEQLKKMPIPYSDAIRFLNALESDDDFKMSPANSL